jgi:methionyl-tRNA formyltransferase
MLRIAFAGTPDFALPALEALAVSPWQLVGVLTQPDRPAGRGRELNAGPVKRRALELGLPVAQPARLKSDAELAALAAWAPDLLVVVAYGLLLPPAVLSLPRLGCLNIHGSLLPRWRGAAPVQRAVLAGDAETGVTIMQLDAGLDTGPTYLHRALPIAPDATSGELAAQLARLGATALIEVIDGLVAGTARAVPQPAEGASYAHKLEKREGLIDWQADARALQRQVCGCNPWPVAETVFAGAQLRVWRAQAVAADAGSVAGEGGALAAGTVLGLAADGLRVQCGHGVLAISELQAAGKRRMSATEFAGPRRLAGSRLGAATAASGGGAP